MVVCVTRVGRSTMFRKAKSISLVFICLTLALGLSGCTDPEVKEAMSAIDAIGEVTIESSEAIEAANEKYDSLDSEKKEQVENYELLKEANERIVKVRNESKCVEAITKGLQSRLDAQKADVTSYSERAGAIASSIQQELHALEELTSLELGGDFKEVLTKYLQSLESQIKGLAEYPGDAESYNGLFIDEGVMKQVPCIDRLMSEYGLTVDKMHKDELDAFMTEEPQRLAAVGQEIEVSTEKGDVKITFDGFVVSAQNTGRAIESGEMTQNQEYGSLLITLENISFDDPNVNGPDDTFVNTEYVYALCDMEGAAFGTFNSSWGYPGYEFTTDLIEIEKGAKKRFEVTYAIDAGATELEVKTTSGLSIILPVNRI